MAQMSLSDVEDDIMSQYIMEKVKTSMFLSVLGSATKTIQCEQRVKRKSFITII